MAPAAMSNLRADLLVDLAVVLRASGNDEAESLIREATDIHARKGNVVSAAWTRGLVGSPSSGSGPQGPTWRTAAPLLPSSFRAV